MVPPVMVTFMTVLTPSLLRVFMVWVFPTVKVTTAVSPALMVVLSSVMVAMGLSFSMGCGLRWGAEFRQEGCGYGAFLLTQWVQELGRVSFAARVQGHGGRGGQRCPLLTPPAATMTCTTDIRETDPTAPKYSIMESIKLIFGLQFIKFGTTVHSAMEHHHSIIWSITSKKLATPGCSKSPPAPGRGWPRTGHSVLEASVHFAGVAGRALVLSALRLRVHERCGDGVRPRRSAPGPKRSARRPKDGRWPAWAGRGQPGAGKAGLIYCAIRCCPALRPQQGV